MCGDTKIINLLLNNVNYYSIRHRYMKYLYQLPVKIVK